MPNIIPMGSRPPSHFTKLEFFARPLRLILGDFQKHNPLAYLLRKAFLPAPLKYLLWFWNFALVTIFFGLPTFVQATIPQIVIHWSTLTETANAYRLQDRNGIPLDGGLAVNGDGSLATLGYFDQATGAEPFKGNWIPMTFGNAR